MLEAKKRAGEEGEGDVQGRSPSSGNPTVLLIKKVTKILIVFVTKEFSSYSARMSFRSRRLRVTFAPEATDECMGSQCCQATQVCPIPSEGCQHTRGDGPDYCRGESCFHNTGCIETVAVAVMADDVLLMGPAELAALHRGVRSRIAFESEVTE